MHVKTSISFTKETLDALDQRVGGRARSHYVEAAVAERLAREAREERDRRDGEILEKYADEFNAEMADILSYQVSLEQLDEDLEAR